VAPWQTPITAKSCPKGSNAASRERCSAECAQLQGRFSGRLAEKADEQRLVAECAALGPLLGESQPQTLSTLVRSIATGKVRKYLEDHLPAPGTETQVPLPSIETQPLLLPFYWPPQLHAPPRS
jgi:hypothetical protein